MISTSFKWFLVAASVSLLTACGGVSLTHVKQFGEASNRFSTSAGDALRYLDTVEVQRKTYALAADPAQGPSDATFTGFFESPTSTRQDAERKDQLALRLKLLSELADYASALEALAADNYIADIDAASGELNGALVGLSATFKKATGAESGLSDDAISVVATAVNAIGKAVTAKKQRAALSRIIPVADPAVQKATKLIAADLSPSSDLAKYAHTSVAVARRALQVAYNAERTKPASTFDARLARLEEIRAMYKAEQGTNTFFWNVSKAADAMARAHAELAKAADTKDLTSKEVFKAIAELQAYVKSVRDFQASLEQGD